MRGAVSFNLLIKNTKMTIPLVVHSDVAETSATGRLASFSSLLHGVYAASADPALWHRALDAIARAMGAVQALLFTLNPAVLPPDFLANPALARPCADRAHSPNG